MNNAKFKEILIGTGIFLLVLAGMVLVPSAVSFVVSKIINDKYIVSIISNIVFIILLFLLYRKDLINEAKIYKNNFFKIIKVAFKYYLIGIGVMLLSNLIIGVALNGGISENETLIRQELFKYPMYFSILSVVVIAPLTEELIFRKSLERFSKNKYIYATLCGLFFGLAHVVTVEFTLFDLLYVIPYGALGFVFGLMNYETKSTFTSMTIHAFHNGLTFILLCLVNAMGVM